MGKQATNTREKKVGKFNRKIANRIISLVKKDDYTHEEICDIVGISRVTLWNWRNRFPEFEEALEEAENDLRQKPHDQPY